MKTIIFLRHAKSSWENFQIPDHERPLNNRGRRDGPRMAKYLAKQIDRVDLIVMSSAQRTRETSLYFVEEFLIKDQAIKDELYDCSSSAFLDEIWSLPKDVDTVLFVGHNPTITEIGMQIQPDFMQNIPTCGMLITQTKETEWANVNFTSLKLKTFMYPKGL